MDLLREQYPNLRGTPEKRDAGVDGISGPDADPEFILVATTAKDFARNLRDSIKRHVEAGGPCRVVVFATTREVTYEKRLSLIEELSNRWGVQLHAVHDRGDFVRLLYGAPQWRKDLLGVAGVAKALSRFPAKARPSPPIPLIGRDDDLQRLRDASGDLVVVGKPGVGKTFLLEQLAAEGWCLFDAGWAMADLEDAIREMRPQRIAVDDAHLAAENRITDIRRLRKEMDADFGIVAVTWPGQADAVSGSLEDATRIEIKELERDQILRIVEDVGVAGPVELQRLIVDQAHGRAGLAVTLAQSCVAGHADEVAKGEALLKDPVGWYHRTLGEASRHTLGALALAGDYGATLEQVREIVGIDGAVASSLLRNMASGGTIDEAPMTFGEIVKGEQANRRMRVQPEALRYALVRDMFFGGPGALDAFGAVEILDHPSIAAVPIIGARYRGAGVSREQLLPLVDWTDEQAARAYALLGSSEFRTALDRAPEHRVSIAGAAYQAGVDDQYALEVLMEEAVGDTRPEHSSPDHPLRAVGDHLVRRQTGIEARRLAVATAQSWLEAGGDGAIGLRVMMHAVYPRLRSGSLDPGLGNTLTIGEGAVPTSWIEELLRLWDEILDVIARNPNPPPGPLLDGLEAWVFPGRIGFGEGPDKETLDAIRGGATHVIERLSRIYETRPGAMSRLQAYTERGGLPVQVDVPAAFSVLYPNFNPRTDEDFQGWRRRVDGQVRLLAENQQERSTEQIALLIAQVDHEAAAAGITRQRETSRLVQILAAATEEPEALLAALTERHASPDLLFPLLDRTVELQRPGWEGILERALAARNSRGAAIRVALMRQCSESLKLLAVKAASEWLHVVEAVVFGGELDEATLTLLLEAPDLSVQRQAAVALGTTTSDTQLANLPPNMLPRWKQIIAHTPVDGDTRVDVMWLPEILKRDHALCGDWVRSWFERCVEGEWEFLPPELQAVVRELPADVRLALVSDVPADGPPIRVREVVQNLVADDLTVASALFDRQDLRDVHDAALRDGPSEAWMDRALLALGRGWTPEKIVEALRSSDVVWTAGGSHWQEKIDGLAGLRAVGSSQSADTQRESIIAAGIALFEKLRDEEIEDERRYRTFGLDS